jgi:hypothetical protein
VHLHLIFCRRLLALWLKVFRLWPEFLCLMKFQEAVYEIILCKQDTSVLFMEVADTCLTLTEPVSSHNRQRFPQFQVQRRGHIDALFYSISCWVSLSYCYLMADFKLWRLEIVCQINLGETFFFSIWDIPVVFNNQ